MKKVNKFLITNLFLFLITSNVYAKPFPSRIVALAPSITEILFAVGAGKKIVGVSSFSNYPPQAQKIVKVGSYIHLNLEKIIFLQPDLAIGMWGNNRKDQIKRLKNAGIKVYMAKEPNSIRDILEVILKVSSVVGSYERGRVLVHTLKKQIYERSKRLKGLKLVKVFFQINNKPIITVNRYTFQNDLIRLARGINIAEDQFIRYPKMSIEQVIAKKPEVILISCMERGGMFEKAKQQWLRWNCIPAVKEGRIYLVNSDLVDRPGPRIAQGLKLLIKLIHPEVKSD